MADLSLQKKAKRLCVYISEKDHWRGNSLDSAIVETLRQKGIAGATVTRGIMGYGAHSLIHSIRIEVLMSDLPVIIEAIDTPEKIESVIDSIYPMVHEGLIMTEDVEIVKYTHRYLNPLPADKLVSEVMTRKVVTLSPDDSIQKAWEIMLKSGVKAVPVIDAKGQLVGILTDEDLLSRAGIQQRLSVAIRMDQAEVNQELQSLKESELTVNDVMTKPVISALQSESLGMATSRMVKYGLKRLPVLDDKGKVAGMLSRLDILRQVAKVDYKSQEPVFPSKAARTVGDIMTTRIPMVNQDDNLILLVEKFSESDSHRLIVVDSEGKAIGLISDSDVVTRVQPEVRRGILSALKNMGKPPVGKETAFDLMSPGVLTVPPTMPVVDALKEMLSESRKWMVVVDENDHPLGLIDRQMMLEAIAVFAP